jgi:methyltransferase-like protein/SAM-dependent methyltransferase
MNDDLRQSYDQLPYDTHAFPQTHPDRLSVVARLFGVTPPSLEACRVLELGCGTGGNLIPMAAGMPGATFVGIDLSPTQIDRGQHRIAELGLSNIELRVGDIAALGDEVGLFDFVIAHGVYSWIPAAVQDALMKLVRRCLAPNGVAYVSYNTFPGWHMRSIIRDAMLYHVRQFKEPAVQTQQARAMLDFLAQSAPGENSPYALQLRAELDELRQQPDHYLYHEHLEAYNSPVYFHEFVERAQAVGLQYLGESEFITMLTSNLPPAAAETLRRVAPDLVRTEQLMDFLRNRPFRQTLLVHQEVTLNRQVTWPVLKALDIGSPAKPVAVPVDERSDAKAEFRMPSGVSMATTTPITKAAFVLMSLRWPRSAPFTELRDAARARLGTLPTAAPDPATVAQDSQALGNELLTCASAGIVELRARGARFSTKVRERPVAWAVARAEARTAMHVSNLRHETVTIDELNRQLLMRLDGTRDRAALADELAELVRTNQLAIQQEGVEVRDPVTVRDVMAKAVDDNLAALARAALFPEDAP